MQTTTTDELSDGQIERMEQSGDEQGIRSSELDYFKKHPLSINRVDREELATLGILSPFQIEQLITYRKWMGPLMDKYELQAVPGWDLSTIRLILPYLHFDHKGIFHAEWVDTKGGEVLQQALFRSGMDGKFAKKQDTSHIGDPVRALFRYQYQSRNLLFGFTASKDAGEPWWSSKPRGILDFRSFHFLSRSDGILRNLVVGDFTVQFGQGLIQWQRLSFGKSGELSSIKRQGLALQPYRSSGPYYFYRGAGVVLVSGRQQWMVFLSRRKLDARMTEDSTGLLPPQVISVIRSGYHRMPSETVTRNKLIVSTWGGQWKYQLDHGHFAFNAVQQIFSDPLATSTDPHARYHIRGKRLSNFSVDHSFTFRNLHWFGEWATREFRSMAWSSGMLLILHPRVEVSILFRSWSPAYQAFFANGVGEGSSVSNERGFLTALVIRPSAFFRIEWMTDLFRQPWLRYQQSRPVTGKEVRVKLTYTFHRNQSIYVLLRKRAGDGDETLPGMPAANEFQHQMLQLRMHAEGRTKKGWELRLRMETNRMQGSGLARFGFLSYAEWGKRFGLSGAVFSVRLLYVSTDDYAGRIYAYEPDVMYAGRMRFFYGQGFRWVLNTSFPIIRSSVGNKKYSLRFWLRFGQSLSWEPNYNSMVFNSINSHGPMECQGQLQFQF